MFKRSESRLIWGVLLILVGVVFLLENLFHLQLGGLFWAGLLGIAGLAFLYVYLSNRTYWWSLIPGFTLLGISATVLLDSYLPRLGDILSGMFVLGGIGIAFVAVYLAERRFWWALIPAGVMLTLSLVTISDNLFGGFGSGGLLFFGLGITFAVIAWLPTPHGQMKWAWFPAAGLFLVGIIVSAAAENLFGYVWPVVLIAGGIILILRTFIKK